MSKRDEDRARRLAQALRANLLKRKAQSRAGVLKNVERDGDAKNDGE